MISMVLEAVNVISGYLCDLEQRKPEGRKREQGLSVLLGRVASASRRVDRRLAKIVALKAQGWSHPRLWESREFKKVPLALDVIRKQSIWLLESEGLSSVEVRGDPRRAGLETRDGNSPWLHEL